MIRDVYSGSRINIFSPSRIQRMQGSKKHRILNPGSATLRESETKGDFRCSVLINQNFENGYRYILNRIQILWNFSEENGY
jgi:hypothetical protein